MNEIFNRAEKSCQTENPIDLLQSGSNSRSAHSILRQQHQHKRYFYHPPTVIYSEKTLPGIFSQKHKTWQNIY